MEAIAKSNLRSCEIHGERHVNELVSKFYFLLRNLLQT